MSTAPERLIVFLHGIGQSPQTWQDQVVALPPGFRAVAPWIFGLRPARTDTFTLDAAVGDVVRTLDLQGVERAVLCGMSLGSWIALEVAVRHPDRVDSVIAASPPPSKLPWAQRLAQRLAVRMVPKSVFSNQSIDKAKTIEVSDAVTRFEFLADVDQIEQRVLLLAGNKDAQSLAAARRLAQRIRQSVVQVIDDAGQDINLHAPEAFNQAVAGFLASPDQSAEQVNDKL